MNGPSFYERRKEAYDWLKSSFPDAFGCTAPLKIGIHQDIFDIESEDRPPKIRLRHAISLHVNRPAYLRGLQAGVERIGLDGCGCNQLVTDDEASGAKERLIKLMAYFKKKNRKSEPKENSESTLPEPKEEAPKLGSGGRPVLSLKKKTA